MDSGVWVWPADPRGQRRILRKVAASEHLMATLAATSKSKEGLSNAEIDYAISDNSNWMTLWVVRQLTALGFVTYRVDLFGGPARYQITPLGRGALGWITGKPTATQTQAPAPQLVAEPTKAQTPQQQ